MIILVQGILFQMEEAENPIKSRRKIYFMADKNHEFIVRFEGVNLSKEASQRIQKGIGNILAQELGSQGSISADDDGDICGVYIPHKWIGRQVMPVDLNKGLANISRADANLSFVASVKGVAH
jgi:hypothetical protein